jgi:hypothetical protein
MQLQVTGIASWKRRYGYLWGKYVFGFNPWEHCQPCLVGEEEPDIKKDMPDCMIELAKPMDFFYLCGRAVKDGDYGSENLHLAVRPKKGSVAMVQSTDGPMFTIHGAEEIQIQDPIEDPAFEHVTNKKLWTRCKNFRFAAQMYAAPRLGPTAVHVPIMTKRMS